MKASCPDRVLSGFDTLISDLFQPDSLEKTIVLGIFHLDSQCSDSRHAVESLRAALLPGRAYNSSCPPL